MPRMRRSDQRVIRHVAKQGEYLKRLKSTGEYSYQIVCQCGYKSEAYSMSKVTALRLCESKHDAHVSSEAKKQSDLGMLKCRTNGTGVEKPPHTIHVLVIGGHKVGKTGLIELLRDTVDREWKQSIVGVEFEEVLGDGLTVAVMKARHGISPKEESGTTDPDEVDNDQIVPQHYGGADNPLEVIKVMREHLTPEEFVGAMKFNVCKYNLRAKKKGGLVDIKKAAYYQNYLVDFMMEKGMER